MSKLQTTIVSETPIIIYTIGYRQTNAAEQIENLVARATVWSISAREQDRRTSPPTTCANAASAGDLRRPCYQLSIQAFVLADQEAGIAKAL